MSMNDGGGMVDLARALPLMLTQGRFVEVCGSRRWSSSRLISRNSP
jgi:hypothetical protein